MAGNRTLATAYMTMGVCLLIFMLPFIICDLHYAYNDRTCVNNRMVNHNISITMKQWLEVMGWLMLAVVTIPFIIGLLTCFSTWAGSFAFICYNIIMGFVWLFFIAWLIVGAVMFWGNLYPRKECSKPVSDYLFARLILGFVGVLVFCYLPFCQMGALGATGGLAGLGFGGATQNPNAGTAGHLYNPSVGTDRQFR